MCKEYFEYSLKAFEKVGEEEEEEETYGLNIVCILRLTGEWVCVVLNFKSGSTFLFCLL